MTTTLRLVTIMAIAFSLAVYGCGKGEKEEKRGADTAPPEVVEKTAEEDAAVEETADAKDVTPPDVDEKEPASDDTAPPPADEEPAEEPDVRDEEPVVSDEEPVVSDEEPVVSDEEPVAEGEPDVPEEKTTDTSDAKGDAGFAYVGAKRCKACHLKQFRSWESTSMATTFESLRAGVKAEAKKKAGLDPAKDYTRDATCLKCHTTGYGKPGGFVSLEATPEMINVQCEACHGPGMEYRTLMKENKEYALADAKAVGLVVPSEDRAGCMQCHGGDNPFTEKVDPKYAFHFEERLKESHEHFPMKYKH